MPIIAIAQDVAATSTSTTTTTLTSLLNPVKGVYNFVVSASPLILLVLGIILIVASKLAQIIGIVLVIFALIQIFLSLSA